MVLINVCLSRKSCPKIFFLLFLYTHFQRRSLLEKKDVAIITLHTELSFLSLFERFQNWQFHRQSKVIFWRSKICMYGVYGASRPSYRLPITKDCINVTDICYPSQDSDIFRRYQDLTDDKQKAELLSILKLRYFTPREVANLHGFPFEFREYYQSFVFYFQS